MHIVVSVLFAAVMLVLSVYLSGVLLQLQMSVQQQKNHLLKHHIQ